jgi:NADP-dependent 3-hydroxy acid dehydrogenase YdfG
MEKLDSKIALIAGGTGSVGEGIVRAFLKQGATVVVPSRTAERLEQLRGYLGELAKDRDFIRFMIGGMQLITLRRILIEAGKRYDNRF